MKTLRVKFSSLFFLYIIMMTFSFTEAANAQPEESLLVLIKRSATGKLFLIQPKSDVFNGGSVSRVLILEKDRKKIAAFKVVGKSGSDTLAVKVVKKYPGSPDLLLNESYSVVYSMNEKDLISPQDIGSLEELEEVKKIEIEKEEDLEFEYDKWNINPIAYLSFFGGLNGSTFFQKETSNLQGTILDVKYNPKWALTGGIAIGAYLSRYFALEFGFQLTKRQYSITADAVDSGTLGTGSLLSGGVGIDVTANYIEVPVLLRVFFLKILTIGVGPYYSLGLGQVTKSYTDETYTKANFKESDMKNYDYGIAGAFGVQFPLSQSIDLFLDGQYRYGLANTAGNNEEIISTTETYTRDERFSSYQGVIGIRFKYVKERRLKSRYF